MREYLSVTLDHGAWPRLACLLGCQVYGDVNQGARIFAAGDVVVFGRLRGEVHAGADGDRDAVVAALVMEPRRIAIAGEQALGPEWLSGAGEPHPEVAAISEEGTITILPASPAERGADDSDRLEAPLARIWKLLLGQLKPTASRSFRPARAALLTGIYIAAAGIVTFCAPAWSFATISLDLLEAYLSLKETIPAPFASHKKAKCLLFVAGLLFDRSTIATGWVQLFGCYYIGAAAGDVLGLGVDGFYISTVIGRAVLFIAFAGLVGFQAVQQSLLILGVINVVGALSMLLALQVRQPAGRQPAARPHMRI
eukprot:SM000018S03629  [mRNA]  locus=s18:468133:470366:+ [translate_table: standard]